MLSQTLLIGAYFVVIAILAVYGFHRSQLLYLLWRNRKNTPTPKELFQEKPLVTIQLPMFNELYVAERLLDAVALIEYPKDRLEIQVLDDSIDETRDLMKKKCEALRAKGVDVVYIHRTDRSGFKAGALEAGLAVAKGEFVAIFDADFIPPPTLLLEMIDHFTDDKVGMVQARWEHINRDFSTLTKVQAILLDGHFLVEHAARNRSGRFFNFNGTAGIWRKSTIQDAGGWQHDTLTEDLDLSYRAQLKGWRFVYLPQIVAPAELPVEMNSFKTQQFRWAKGSIQTMRKLLPMIWRAPLPWKVKSEALFHLTNNFAYGFLVLLAMLSLPTLVLRSDQDINDVLMIDLPLFLGTTFSVGAFYMASQLLSKGSWRQMVQIPAALSVGIGISLNNTRAILEGLFGVESEFVRTPKHGVTQKSRDWLKMKYRTAKGFLPFLELAFALYFAVSIWFAISTGHPFSAAFLALFFCGFLYVGSLSLLQRR